ncbi:MAG: PAS domain-containing methyl-accepting chemotaxis protein [Pseudomonadota bacterium]
MKSALTRAELSNFLMVTDEAQGVIVLSPQAKILDVNDRLAADLGYAKDELVGFDVTVFRALSAGEPADLKDDDNLWKALRGGEIAYRLFEIPTKTNATRYYAQRYYPLLRSDGGLTKVVVLASDITREYEDKASMKARAGAIDKTQAVIEFSVDGTILDANANFCEAMGYTHEEIVGRHHKIFVGPDIMSSADYERFWVELRAGQIHSGEFRRRRKDGSDCYIAASYALVCDERDRPLRVVKVAQDITDMVRERERAAAVAKQVDERLETIVSAVSNVNQRSASASSAVGLTSDTVKRASEAVHGFESSSQKILDAMGRSERAVKDVISETATADKHIEELSGAAESMSSIVEIIQKVAGQINLLALNATIESARAGEAGRGFAVVAAEVKSLADQVGKSTNQIAGDISRVQGVSQSVVKGLRGITKAVQDMEESVANAGEAVGAQTEAAHEIADGMRQAVTSVEAINDNLADISSAVSNADEHAREGSRLYRSLSQSRAS